MAIAFGARDLSIRAKLRLAFATLIVLFALLGSTAILRFNSMASTAQDLASNSTLAIAYISDMREAVVAYRAALLRAITLRDATPGAADRLNAALGAITAQLTAAEAKYAPTVDTGEETQIYQEFRSKWAEYLRASEPQKQLVAAGHFDEAAALVAPLVPLGAAADAALRKDADFNADEAATRAEQMVQANAWSTRVVLGTVATSVVVSVFAGWLLLRTIAEPIRQMTDAMRRLAQHDMEAEIAGVGRRDEIGAMASALQVFKESIVTA
ncbi:MAG: MCP four helix bundle domain-containing protein, partial [Acetobacteraceae bacterium]|nr:MCP four helix bundle domain-containing protein [Acetobacteraceae bacterium]